MSTRFKRKLIATVFVLLATLCSLAVFADQQDFELRKEQQLWPHDFDVKHYRITLSLEQSTRSFEGETAITFASVIDGLSTLILDAETFSVQSVTDNGKALAFNHENGKFEISLNRALATGEEATLSIRYSVTNIEIDSSKYGIGVNYDLGFNFKSESPTNPQIIFTLNFPEGARHWFPAFDHPSDWATHETIISLRADYRVVANGALVSDRFDPESGRRTVHWRQTRPQPTYLYVMVAGNHSVLDDSHGDLPLHYWVYPGDEADARLSFSATPKMRFVSKICGSSVVWASSQVRDIGRFRHTDRSEIRMIFS